MIAFVHTKYTEWTTSLKHIQLQLILFMWFFDNPIIAKSDLFMKCSTTFSSLKDLLQKKDNYMWQPTNNSTYLARHAIKVIAN